MHMRGRTAFAKPRPWTVGIISRLGGGGVRSRTRELFDELARADGTRGASEATAGNCYASGSEQLTASKQGQDEWVLRRGAAHSPDELSFEHMSNIIIW